MRQRLIIILFLLCPAVTTFSQKILKITDIEESNAIFQDYIEVYVDSTNELDFDQVSSEEYSKHFVPVSEFEEEASISNTYWLHFILENKIADSLSLGFHFHDDNQVVIVYSILDGSIQRKRTGFLVTGKQNDELIPFSNIIQVPGSEPIEYFLKIKNIRYSKQANFNLKFIDIGKEYSRKNRSDIFQSFVQGALFLMILYGLFLFFNTRDKVYLFYSLYIITISIWALFYLGYQFIYSLPRDIFHFSVVFGLLACYFYLWFARSFINTEITLPKWDRSIRIFQVFLLIAIVGLHLPPLIIRSLDVSVYLHGSVIAAYSIFVCIFIIRIFRSNIQFSNIIWIGTSFLILGFIGSLYRYYVKLDDLYYFGKIGILLELIVFSYGITHRYKLIEREKRRYQSQLIDQLKENSEIQERANRELEGKVRRRTAEIAEKNDLLSSQNEEIASQNDLLLHQNEEIEAQRDELEIQRDVVLAQKDEIVDSITYAQRIQAAMLPPDTYFTELLNENFIFYKPRDIVSGDFYWIKQVNMSVILVAADCTGHGVPGALLSMLGISYLDEIVQRREITQANQVLNELRKQIKHSLRQHGQMDESRDGIDLALCVFDLKNREMQYSGANNPLYLIKDVNGAPELNEIKADPMPLGYYQGKDTSFTNHSIQLEMGDTFYLFSDGFIDQKGGRDNKKFMSKNFKKLLLEIHDRPMHEQKDILDKTLSDWMGDNSQMDDVLVVGVRV